MRIFCLPFAFAIVLIGNATVAFAFPTVGHCYPLAPANALVQSVSVEAFAPGSLPPLPSFDAEARDYLIRTIAFEAPDETEAGKAAVAHVILNRMRLGKWGDSIKDIVMQKGQFEPWATRRGEIEGLALDDTRYRDAAHIADGVLSGALPDPTSGATYFLNAAVVRERRGGSLPDWAEGDGHLIGRHTFYAPATAPAPSAPPEDWRYLRIKPSPSSC